MSTPTECGVAPADISDADTDEDANDDDDADDDDDDGEEEDDDDGDAAIKRLLMEIVVFDTGPNTPGCLNTRLNYPNLRGQNKFSGFGGSKNAKAAHPNPKLRHYTRLCSNAAALNLINASATG